METLMKSPAVRRHLFRQFVDEHSKELVRATTLIYASFRSQREAEQLQENMIDAVGKMVLLHRKRLIEPERMFQIRRAFRLICSSITNSFRFVLIRGVDDVSV
jgi:hypothetical protein